MMSYELRRLHFYINVELKFLYHNIFYNIEFIIFYS